MADIHDGQTGCSSSFQYSLADVHALIVKCSAEVDVLTQKHEQQARRQSSAEQAQSGQLACMSARVFEVERGLRDAQDLQQEAIEKAGAAFKLRAAEAQQDRQSASGSFERLSDSMAHIARGAVEDRGSVGMLRQDLAALQRALHETQQFTSQVHALALSAGQASARLTHHEDVIYEVDLRHRALLDQFVQLRETVMRLQSEIDDSVGSRRSDAGRQQFYGSLCAPRADSATTTDLCSTTQSPVSNVKLDQVDSSGLEADDGSLVARRCSSPRIERTSSCVACFDEAASDAPAASAMQSSLQQEDAFTDPCEAEHDTRMTPNEDSRTDQVTTSIVSTPEVQASGSTFQDRAPVLRPSAYPAPGLRRSWRSRGGHSRGAEQATQGSVGADGFVVSNLKGVAGNGQTEMQFE